jgi:7-cyano-7-deazaguanine synthase
LEAPFIDNSKADIVQAAHDLKAPVALSHSCYQGLRPACGVCDTCTVRIDAFRQVGFIDPIAYQVPIDWGNAKPFGI